MRIEMVVWRDTYFIRDDDGGDLPHDDYLMETFGYTDIQVASDGRRWVVVRSERDTAIDGYRAVTRIPEENVVKRVPLRVEDKVA